MSSNSYRQRSNGGFWGRRSGELVFNGGRVLVVEVENLLEMDGGDSPTAMRMYLLTLSCTLEGA